MDKLPLQTKCMKEGYYLNRPNSLFCKKCSLCQEGVSSPFNCLNSFSDEIYKQPNHQQLIFQTEIDSNIMISPCKCRKYYHSQCIINFCIFYLSVKCNDCHTFYNINLINHQLKLDLKYWLNQFIIFCGYCIIILLQVIIIKYKLLKEKWLFWNYIIAILMSLIAIVLLYKHIVKTINEIKLKRLYNSKILIVNYNKNKKFNDDYFKEIEMFFMQLYNCCSIDALYQIKKERNTNKLTGALIINQTIDDVPKMRVEYSEIKIISERNDNESEGLLNDVSLLTISNYKRTSKRSLKRFQTVKETNTDSNFKEKIHSSSEAEDFFKFKSKTNQIDRNVFDSSSSESESLIHNIPAVIIETNYVDDTKLLLNKLTNQYQLNNPFNRNLMNNKRNNVLSLNDSNHFFLFNQKSNETYQTPKFYSNLNNHFANNNSGNTLLKEDK